LLPWQTSSFSCSSSFANRSMFGVRYPMTPWLYALRLNHLMSPAQMTRMLAFSRHSIQP
jgi:hypothetical protein